MSGVIKGLAGDLTHLIKKQEVIKYSVTTIENGDEVNADIVSELYAMDAHKNENSALNKLIAESEISGVEPKFLAYKLGART